MANLSSSKDKKPGKTAKGETQPRKQKGALSSSNKTKEKHEKDESSGAKKNTTKKQQNSI